MSANRLLSLAIALLFGTVLAAGGLLLQEGGRSLLTRAERDVIETTALVLSTAMAQSANLSATHAQLIGRDPTVRTLLAIGERQGLLAHMKPAFDTLKAEAGVNVMQFHDKTMRSFLRVWEPENFGQDLSRIRPMVLASNHSGRTEKGIELGLSGLSLRAVAPVMEGTVLIGTVEVGADLKALMELAKSSTGADFALFLDSEIAPARKDGKNQEIFGSLRLESATDTALAETIGRARLVKPGRAATLDSQTVSGKRLGILSQPLLDYSGRQIGTMVVARDFTALEGTLDRAMVTVVTLFLIGLILGYGIVTVTVRAAVLAPLRKLTARIDSGGPQPGDAPLSGLSEFACLEQALRRRLETADDQR